MQGCQLVGNFQINRVPGSFSISSNNFQDIIQNLSLQGYKFDYSFKINHLSFGKQEDFKSIQDTFTNIGVINPLDGIEIKAEKDQNDKPRLMSTNIYLIAVPSYFRDTSGNNYNMY